MSRKHSANPRHRPRDKIQSEWFKGKSRAEIFKGLEQAGWTKREAGHIVFSKEGFGTISFPRTGELNPSIAALKFSQAGITRNEAKLILGIAP